MPLRPALTLAFVAGLAALFSPVASAQAVRLVATVVDAQTGAPVAGANARVDGTRQGVAADSAGRFALTLGALPASVTVRAVGYREAAVRVRRGDSREGVVVRTVRLEPAPVELGQVEVTGETAAERLLRRVIERKAALAPRVGSYALEAYTRHAVQREGLGGGSTLRPVRFVEVLSRVYWRAGGDDRGGAREEAVARRRVPDGRPLRYADVAPVPDLFFADAALLDGVRFRSPIRPDALDHYAVQLGDTTFARGLRLIDVALVPLRPGPGVFAGRLRVVDSLFVLAEAEFRASDPEDRSQVDRLDATYTLTYTPATADVWLPARFVRAGRVVFGGASATLTPFHFRQETTLAAPALGRPGPPVLWTRDDPYRSPAGLYGGPEAFARYHAERPLTDDERAVEDALRGRTLRSVLWQRGALANAPFLFGAFRFPIEADDDPAFDE